MALGPRLELKQTQSLTMTPQLRHAISLLQMSNVELAAHLAEEADKNPLLEIVEPEIDPSAQSTGSTLAPSSSGVEHSEIPLPITNNFNGYDPLQSLEYEESLRERLKAQIQISVKDAQLAQIIFKLIEELDENGWLTTPIFEISDVLRVPQSKVEEALEILQECGPAGIAARNLRECLELQLKDAEQFSPLMQVLTANLNELAEENWAKLERLSGANRTELETAIANLKRLNPRPFNGLIGDVAPTAIADVSVLPNPTGGWSVELNADSLPKVLVNEKYASEVSKDGGTVSEFLTECRKNARFLVKAMDQRAKTILRVATVIVRHQNRFFDQGLEGLRPLTLGAVADELGIHESTVSRVTSGKYLYCLRGTFELRFFFAQAIPRNDGGLDMAAPVIRERIRDIVSSESHNRVFSDEKITKILQEDGVDIARRTVAKYREAMGIPSSSRRRRIRT